MTNTGKCDICRTRKVKCDERKPTCTPCSKRDRPCTYSFGKVSAFVAEDPTQLSRHGKAKVAPIVYPLFSSTSTSSDSSSPPIDTPPSTMPTSPKLRTTTERDAEDGQGSFITLSVVSKEKPKGIRKPTVQQKRKLQAHLCHLQNAFLNMPTPLLTQDITLAARYLNILGDRPLDLQPLALLGSWIQSIPSRLGHNPVVDLAVEYLADSFVVWRDGNFSNRRAAMTTKAKALKALQLAVGDDDTRATYDTVLAMKIHFTCELFMGIKNLYHAIHAAGLAEILKLGPVSGFDEEHYWSFLDNTYIDDVTEAMVSGRTSVYDNEYYLEATSPSAIPREASTEYRLSIAIMHVFIQLPRLVCLVRHAIGNPEESSTIQSAITLAESIWMMDPFNTAQVLFDASTTIIQTAPSPSISDIISDSFDFSSVESVILLSRYWSFVLDLCGLTESCYLHFPTQVTNSLLPDLRTIQQRDIEAARNLARCVRYSCDVCPSLPLLPLRIHTTFQLSIGSWHRLVERLTRANQDLESMFLMPEDTDPYDELRKAQRMEDWVADECNRIHSTWKVNKVSKKFLLAAVVDMSGGPIPDWLPTRVRFDCENGNMVMKLEYDVPGPVYERLYGKPEHQWTRSTTTASPFGQKRWVPTNPYPTGIMTRLPFNRGDSPE